MSFARRNFKPIIFNTNMVEAILDGSKTQTRRIIKPKYKPKEAGWNIVTNKHTGEFCYCEYYDEYEESTRRLNPPYFPGDILWVRETWNYGYIETSDAEHSHESWFEPVDYKTREDHSYLHACSNFFYRADDEDWYNSVGMFWKPSIHMPKEAARIFLKVNKVWVERLQDISEGDVYAEGYKGCDLEHSVYYLEGGMEACFNTEDCSLNHECLKMSSSELFGRDIWNPTIKKEDKEKYSWEANPLVWVYEFERCKQLDFN